MRLSTRVGGFQASGAADPPEVRATVQAYNSGPSNPYDLTTSGMSWMAGDLVFAMWAGNNNQSVKSPITAIAGQDGTDPDTYANYLTIDAALGAAENSIYKGTIVSPFDAATRFTRATLRRGIAAVAVCSGAGANFDGTPVQNEGDSAAPKGLSMTTTVANCRVFCFLSKIGSVSIVDRAVPAGWTEHFYLSGENGNNDTSSHSTGALISKVFASAAATGDVDWTVPAGASAPWSTIMFGVPPS